MICQRCRTTLLSRLHFQQHAIRLPSSACLLTGHQNARFYSSDTPNIPAMPPPPAPRQHGSGSVSIPSAISSATPGVSQPLSTPTEAVHVDISSSTAPSQSAKTAVQREPSSCPAGTKMNGLSYMKNKPEVFALEDSEYPDWLWTLLDSSKKQTKSELGGVDPSTLNRKQRKRHEKKMAALSASLPRQIPLHEQATDLTPATYNRTDNHSQDIFAEAAASLDQRQAITKSARDARRKEIRESNYLRGL